MNALDAAREWVEVKCVGHNTGSAGTLRFSPTDETTVDSSQPTVNPAICSRFTADNCLPNSALPTFNVSLMAESSISSAKLQLTVGVTAIEGRFQAAGLAQLELDRGLNLTHAHGYPVRWWLLRCDVEKHDTPKVTNSLPAQRRSSQ